MGPNDWMRGAKQQGQRLSMVVFVLSLTGMVSLILHFNELQAEEKLTEYGKEKEYEPPIRKVSIIATPEGFYPKNFAAFVGERVKFFVTSTTERPSCFIVKGKDIFLQAKKGEVREAEIFVKEPGTYKFYCPQGKIEGQMTVLRHPKDVRRERQRNIASDSKEGKKVKIWIPEDE